MKISTKFDFLFPQKKLKAPKFSAYKTIFIKLAKQLELETKIGKRNGIFVIPEYKFADKKDMPLAVIGALTGDWLRLLREMAGDRVLLRVGYCKVTTNELGEKVLEIELEKKIGRARAELVKRNIERFLFQTGSVVLKESDIDIEEEDDALETDSDTLLDEVDLNNPVIIEEDEDEDEVGLKEILEEITLRQVFEPPVKSTLEKATVMSEDGAGLHKSNRKEVDDDVDVEVREGGAFGAGIKFTIPKGTVINVDYSKPVEDAQYVYAECQHKNRLRVGYVKKEYLTRERTLGRSQAVIKAYPGKQTVHFVLQGEEVPTELTIQEAYKLKQLLERFEKEEEDLGFGIAGKEDVIRAIIKKKTQAVSLTAIADTVDAWLEQGLPQLAETILPRVHEERNALIKSGLINKNHKLKSIKFSGSDFHKGGQQVAFLNFVDTEEETEKRVVYKPSSLEMDYLLFSNLDGGTSVANLLDPTGELLPTYGIMPSGGVEGDKGFGFMEFVPSGLPKSSAELMKLYKSISANMAMSYFMGLQDVHQENHLLLGDKMQIIDMEASTGAFKFDPLNPDTSAAWNGQEWGGTFMGLRNNLFSLEVTNALEKVPKNDEVTNQCKAAFKAVYDKGSDASSDGAWNLLKRAFSGVRARLVPIKTEVFYGFVSLVQATVDITFETWCDWADNDTNEIVTKSRDGQPSTSLASLKNLLKSPGTFEALKNGDIPYFTLDLGTGTAYDEKGNPIDVTGHSKVAGAIDEVIQSRRRPNDDDYYNALESVFVRQGLNQLIAINTEIVNRTKSRLGE